MDESDSLEMFTSCDLYADGEITSQKKISISVIKLDNESLLHSNTKLCSLQEDCRFPVLFNGRSYVKRMDHSKVNANVNPLKSQTCISADKKTSNPLIHQSDTFPIKNLRKEIKHVPKDTKVYHEMKDIKAPISDIEDEDQAATIDCFKEENECQNPALKDLIRNIETYYHENENALSKVISTKRIKHGKFSGVVQERVKDMSSFNNNETVWFGCQKCCLEFSTPKGLANHVKTHPKVMVDKNACVYCGKCVDGAGDLNNHLNAEHLFDIINYTCESCQTECISADLFDKHQYFCHKKQDTSCLFCSNCDKVYYDQDMYTYHKEQLKHCCICSLNYCMSSDQFKAHKEKHILFKYKCPDCNSSFITKSSLTKHLETKNLCFQKLSKKSVNCAVNSEELDYEQEKKSVVGIEEERSGFEKRNACFSKKEKIHKCPLCTAKFALQKNMWRHVVVVHSKDLQDGSLQNLLTLQGHQCTMCHKTVTRKSNLVAHMASHIRRTSSMDNGQPKCSVCQKTFRLQRYLVDHMRLHTGRGTHQCRHCDKKFLRRSHLKLHMEMHENFQKFHSCLHCDKIYMRKRDQIHHMRVKHGTSVGDTTKRETLKAEGFPCSACDKIFSTLLKLQMHQVRHTVTKPYKCQECFREFPTLSTLKRHYLVHWDLRPFSCSTCSKSFRYAQSLKRHMITHTAERPHVCQQCGKDFALKGTLNVHMQQHSTSRTFKCYKCEEVFASKQEMKSHHCIQNTKDKPVAESVSAEYCVLSKASVYMTYDNVVSKGNKGSTDEPVARLVPDVLDDLTSVTTLISDSCIAPVAGLVSNNITNTVTPVGHLVTEVDSEMIPASKTVPSSNFTKVPYEAQNSEASQNIEDTFEDGNLLGSTSHLPSASQTDVLSQAYAVVDENVVTDCVNLSDCSVLETNQEPEVSESTIYTLVTIDSEVEQPTFITIPTVSNSGSEENVTLQINFPEDGCSEVFIIKG